MFVFIGTKKQDRLRQREYEREGEGDRGDRDMYIVSFWMNANQTLNDIRNGNLIQRLAERLSRLMLHMVFSSIY